jgi:mono/diheme cytochrome c family protein
MTHLASARRVFLLLLFLAVLLPISACSSPEGNVADGQRWYRMHTCYACHGEDGNGRRGGPAVANIDMEYRSFVHRLRNPKTAIMPAYGEEKINDQDAADILAFLKSLEKKPSN